MALKANEQAVINLVINGEQSKTSLREVTGAVNALAAELSRAKQANDPAAVKKASDEWTKLKQIQTEMRNELFKTGDAQKGFFADFKKGFSELEEMAGKVTIGTIIATGVHSAIDFVKDFFVGAVEAYEEAQRTQTQLQQVVKTTGVVAGQTKEQLDEYQKSLMDQTGIDDDVIAKGEEMLLTFTNIRGKIYEEALPAIVDMTAALNGGKVTMEGIQATSIQVGKALNDPINGMAALKKVGVTLDETQKQQIITFQKNNDIMGAQGIILKELQKEFGGTAKAIADTDVGAAQKFETRIGNIKENIGGLITTMKGGLERAFDPFLNWLEKATATTLPEKLQDEQGELNGLVGAIISCNNNQAVRNQLITELQQKYPDFLGNIDKESASNDLLLRRMTALNEQYRQKIFIAANQDKLTEAQEKYSKAIRDEADARERISKTSGLSLEQLANMTDDEVKRMALGNKNMENLVKSGDQGIKDIQAILEGRQREQGALSEINDLQKAMAVQNEKLHELEISNIDKEIAKIKEKKSAEKEAAAAKKDQEEIDRLQQSRDILTGNIKQGTTGPTKADIDAAERKRLQQKKALQEYQNQLRETRDQIDQLIAGATKGTEAGLDAQLKVIDDKYQTLIAKLRELNGNKDATEADKTANNKQIAELQTDDTAAKLLAVNDAAYKHDLQILQAQAAGKQEVLEQQRANDLISQDRYEKQKGEMEQSAYEDEYYLAVYYGENTVSIEKKLADIEIANKKRVHDATLKNIKEEKEAEQDFYKAKQEIEAAKAALIQSGFELVNAIFGKNKALLLAELAIEKVIAIGKIKASEGVEIAGYFAKYALVPGGEFIAAGLAAAAETRANLSIIEIIASGLAEGIGDLTSGNAPKAAKGGIFDGASHGQGGMSVFDNTTGKKVVEVEGGEPWMVLSQETQRNNAALINQLLFNSMFRNGAAVDVRGINSGIQTAKNGGVFAATRQPDVSASHSHQSAQSNDASRLKRLEAIIAQQLAINERQAQINEIPVSFNTRTYDKVNERNVQIKTNSKA